jgi:Icc-related predicted phosphoesterase
VTACFFVSDLHGRIDRYEELFRLLDAERPDALFLGGDFLPQGHRANPAGRSGRDFVRGYLAPELDRLRRRMGESYPRIFVIMGNDDRRAEEPAVLETERSGLWEYIHEKRTAFGEFQVYGYACVPPTPFLLKDWERYDVSRYVDPGCVSPEEGRRSVPVDERKRKFSTIQADLDRLAGDAPLDDAVFLFHTPPYNTRLDRAGLDGVKVDGVLLDVHVGSVAVRRLIESRQPLLTLHGHIHESARLSHAWQDRIGRTVMLSAAHDGPELALIRFDPENPAAASRELLQKAAAGGAAPGVSRRRSENRS